MTKKQNKKTTPQKNKAKNIFRAFLFFVFTVIVFFLFVDQGKLPKSVQDNPVITMGYDLKKDIFPPAQPVAKETPKKEAQGYSPEDRAKLEKIISKGAEDY